MAIKHTVPAGLPTGTVAGVVAGDDWRASHTAPDFERGLILGTTAALTPAAASAAAGTELYSTSKVCRVVEDLRYVTQVRMTALVIATGNVSGVTWDLQYRTTDASSWSGGTTTGCSLAIGTATAGVLRDTGWVSLPGGAQIATCYLSVVVGSTAQGTTAPTVGSLRLYFR